MKITKFTKLAIQCQTDTVDPAIKNDDFKQFNQYYLTPGFDSIKIDREVDGNLLLFTMLYSYHKLDWKNTIPKLNEEKYANLAY